MDTFGQTADDVAEKLCRQDTVTGIRYLSLDLVCDGSFHIITGQVQTHTCLAQDALDHGKTALLSHGTSCNVQTLYQHAFFTGKTHSQFPSLLK